MLKKSFPQNYQSFICSLKRQARINLQSLITNLIEEETLIKDMSFIAKKHINILCWKENFH